MMKEKSYVKGTIRLLDLFNSHKKPYKIRLLGKRWLVLPYVFSPKYAKDVQCFMKWLPSVKGKSCLEIGCGTGIASIEMAARGAKTVVSVDISTNAVDNTKLNAKAHNVSIDVRQSDLFDNIRRLEKFDLIFFNPPFGFKSKPVKTLLEKSVWDCKYTTLRRFLKEAKKHLSDEGEIILGFSTIGHISFLQRTVKKYGYKMVEIGSEHAINSAGLHHIYKMYELFPQ